MASIDTDKLAVDMHMMLFLMDVMNASLPKDKSATLHFKGHTAIYGADGSLILSAALGIGNAYHLEGQEAYQTALDGVSEEHRQNAQIYTEAFLKAWKASAEMVAKAKRVHTPADIKKALNAALKHVGITAEVAMKMLAIGILRR